MLKSHFHVLTFELGCAVPTMLTVVVGTGGIKGADGGGNTGMEIVVSAFTLSVDFVGCECECSTLLNLSLKAFRAICLKEKTYLTKNT